MPFRAQSAVSPLVVTSFTSVTCLGRGVEALWRGLAERRSGLEPCAFEDVALGTFIGRVEGLERLPVRGDLAAFDCRNNRLAELALNQDGFLAAVLAARERFGPARVAVIIGTSTSGIMQTERAYQRLDPVTGALPPIHYAETQNTFSLGAFVRRYLGLGGPAHVVSTACSSSAKVFGDAARLLEAGLADAAVVGGCDTLCLTTLYGFGSLELLSDRPCRPFDPDRNGISIGEGAGFALLTRPDASGGAGRFVLTGVGESCDAYHMSTPHPEGLGATLAMQRALASGGLAPEAIGYVNLHGTATRSNDTAEGHAVAKLFGKEVPCSATKGATGHLLGAAGIAEAVISMLSLEHDWLPGTANSRAVDPGCECRVLLEGEGAAPRYVLSNSFGFGGNNCSLVFGRA
jgi:3-oxoacyl-[acyl-carrier-protein] synthase-1